MLRKFFGICLLVLSGLFFNNAIAADVPALIDPYVYVNNETNQPYNIEWEIAKVKLGEQPMVFGNGKASVAPHVVNANVGKFDWFEKAGKHGVDVNKVTVKVFDSKNHLLYQQVAEKEHIFVGADAKLDKKLNLFVKISEDKKLAIRISEK